MITKTRGFPSVIPDNEMVYYRHVQAAVESVDPDSTMEITKGVSNVSVRLSPSHPKFITSLMRALTDIHNALKLRVIFSKSIKTTCTINYQINLES